MLKEIYIKNLAVIKEATIPFGEKLNIFTGETGAGKSILIGGINAVLGQRTTRDIVRTGCSKAEITALFTELPSDVLQKLDELGISYDNDEITVTREISADGKSVSRINGRTASATLLREIGCMLINIHGQHDNQVLLDSEKHISILDSFGNDYTLLNEYRKVFRELQTTARKLGELKKLEQTKNERLRYLSEIIEEIGSLELSKGEEESLEREYETAKSAESIITSLNNAVQVLSGENTAGDMIVTAENEISGCTESAEDISSLYERLSAVEIEISDISSELERIAEKTELDGRKLEYLSERIGSINRLKRKYLTDFDGLIELYEKSCSESAELESNSGEIRELSEKRDSLLHEVTEKAKKLYDYREETGRRFAQKVTGELEFLNMQGAVIEVKHGKGKLTVNGMDTVEFLISANKGEDPKPISKTASGGELSRIMLALKSVIADRDSIPTMIFDEIDTGVSGKTAQKIGIKLHEIGEKRQVICVTHLSQIAVQADNHLMIEKKVNGERTETQVVQLDLDGRVAEVARIMGGENPSQLMLDTARQLITDL